MKGIAKIMALFGPLQFVMFLPVCMAQDPSLTDGRLDSAVAPHALTVQSIDELEVLFAELDYVWPLRKGDAVPAIALKYFPEDLVHVSDVSRKKALFFRALLPLLVLENEQLLLLRQRLLMLFAQSSVADAEQQWLVSLAARYRVTGDLVDSQVRQKLLRRLDVLPPALALAQAANESAWGTSRFARLGNNLFGQWTYNESEGLVPLNRPEGATYAVRKFASLEVSVQAYTHNLNTHQAYRELRLMRERMRAEGDELEAIELAAGLLAYSARGEAYVAEIQAMIRGNRLLAFSQTPALRSGQPRLLTADGQKVGAVFVE